MSKQANHLNQVIEIFTVNYRGTLQRDGDYRIFSGAARREEDVEWEPTMIEPPETSRTPLDMDRLMPKVEKNR